MAIDNTTLGGIVNKYKGQKHYKDLIGEASEGFVLQKGKTALENFKNSITIPFEYDKTTKVKAEMEPFLKVVAYCDVNAYKKKELNEYPDKRVVAKAMVRMGPWFSNMMQYHKDKKTDNIKSPAVKYALDYLNDPVNNFPIVAEKNYRAISTYFLGTEYDPNSFVDGMKTKFKDLLGDVTECNKTWVITKFLFDNKVLWDPNLEGYVEQLKKNFNLILTGAPGTGKTYMTKQIACNLMFDKLLDNLSDEEKNVFSQRYKFVQFHPSYDYTDFVEGLRPVKSETGSVIEFERRDGVFKEFCKKALEALKNNKDYKKAKKVFDREQTVDNANKLSDAIAKAPKYVFVIDEINRGEMSKIFGELFFSIDPGYRGEKGLVQTQYQNLIDKKTDVFKDGFYVPENVYIIGTMNDIDRSVDSMDFAMRRRFAWMEVTAEESAENMGLPDESIARMAALNEAIEDIDGLDSSYDIGAAYFLKLDKCGNGKDRYDKLWDFYISGVVKEYLRGMSDAGDLLKKLKKVYDLES